MLGLSNRFHTRVFENGEERIAPVATLCERFGVDALIRLGAEDYDLLAPMRGRFVHFNLETTLNEVGKRYAILPIVKAGRRDENDLEILPVVDPLRYRSGICEDVLQRVSLQEVEPKYFALSLPNIRNSHELEAALIKRYAPMFPRLSTQDIVARGCAITVLSLE